MIMIPSSGSPKPATDANQPASLISDPAAPLTADTKPPAIQTNNTNGTLLSRILQMSLPPNFASTNPCCSNLKETKFHPYKPQIHQEIKEVDRNKRTEHSIAMLDLIEGSIFRLPLV
uniref:Uncharacterized protein n=1 Tax=Ditylenchus dipsaci TaxID=166011 RepID=A0A915CXH8_9BILA